MKHADKYPFKVTHWVKWHSMYRPQPKKASGVYMLWNRVL